MSVPQNTNEFMTEFRGFHDCFSVVGGTPTVLYFEQRLGKSERTTKDLDIVILDIAPDERWKEFVYAFQAYTKRNQYECKSLSSGKSQSYRFENPNNPLAPRILEISSRRTDLLIDQTVQRLEEFDMSAIVCESYFVDLLKAHRELISMGAGLELPSTKITVLVLMKAFAVLNLEKSDDSNARSKKDKHLNDIARLTRGLVDDDQITVPMEAFKHLEILLIRKEEFYDRARLHSCGWKGEEALKLLETTLLNTISPELSTAHS